MFMRSKWWDSYVVRIAEIWADMDDANRIEEGRRCIRKLLELAEDAKRIKWLPLTTVRPRPPRIDDGRTTPRIGPDPDERARCPWLAEPAASEDEDDDEAQAGNGAVLRRSVRDDDTAG
jgi:hypothetical protein